MQAVQMQYLKPYLRAENVRTSINQYRPTYLSQSLQVLSKTLAGSIGGGVVGSLIPIALEHCCQNEFLNMTVRHFVKILVPSVTTLDALPLKFAGLGGVLLFCFAFYKQSNLRAQANAAVGTLGKNPHRIITKTELENIDLFMPNNFFKGVLEFKYTVPEDEEINALLEKKKKELLLDEIIPEILSSDSNEKMKQRYQNISREVNDEEIILFLLKVDPYLAEKKMFDEPAKQFIKSNNLQEVLDAVLEKGKKKFLPQNFDPIQDI